MVLHAEQRIFDDGRVRLRVELALGRRQGRDRRRRGAENTAALNVTPVPEPTTPSPPALDAAGAAATAGGTGAGRAASFGP